MSNNNSPENTVQTALDEHAAKLDAQTVSALDKARLEAVKAFNQTHTSPTRWFGRQAVSVWATSAAAVLLAAVMLGPNLRPAGDAPVLLDEDLEILQSADTYDMLQEDLDFYAWLALQ